MFMRMTEHSHKFPDAPVRKPTNVTLDSALVAEARSLGINITNHEQHQLMRQFDVNSDGKVSMEEFYNTLAKDF